MNEEIKTTQTDFENTENIITETENMAVKTKEKFNYSKTDIIFAFLTLVIGFLLVKLVFAGGLGFGAAIFFTLLLTVCVMYYRLKEVSFTKGDILKIIIGYLSAFNFALYDNTFLKLLNFLFSSLIIAYFCYTVNNKDRKKEMFIRDMTKAALVMPVSSPSDCPGAIGAAVSKSNTAKNIKNVLLGFLIAFPCLCIVVSLLMNGDIMFESLMDNVFDNVGSDLLIFVFQLAVGTPIAFFIFSMIFGNVERKSNVLSDEGCKSLARSAGVMPQVMMFSAVAPLILIYILFFVSQAGYFLSAFSNILPENFSYSSYARKGFFELCTVSAINLFVLISMRSFVRKDEDKKSKAVSFFTVTLSLMTIMLIATALSKMIMYIDNYGLSLLRIYTSWFMVLLLVLFTLIIIKEFAPKIRMWTIFTAIFCVMFFTLTYCDVDAITARYNIQRYYDHKDDRIDIRMLDDMSASVVPILDELDDDVQTNGYMELERYIDNMAKNAWYKDWREQSVATIIASQFAVDN